MMLHNMEKNTILWQPYKRTGKKNKQEQKQCFKSSSTFIIIIVRALPPYDDRLSLAVDLWIVLILQAK